MRWAFSLYSPSIRSIVASAAAKHTGFPPNVVPCAPGPQRITLSLAMIAPSGMPLAMPFAEHRMSGSIPACSLAHHFAVRPMPDCTSSTMNMIPCWRQIRCNSWRKNFGAGTYPPSPWMGSMMMPATSSGSNKRLKICPSSCSRISAPQVSALCPWAQR